MTLWMSQILQAMAIKYAVEHWRRSIKKAVGAVEETAMSGQEPG